MNKFLKFLCFLKFATCADLGQSMMLVNNQVIGVVSESPLVYKGNYTFVDGELTKFTCIRDNGIYHAHIIKYQDKVNEYDVTAIDNNSSSLYIKLKKENSPKYIDCINEKLYKNPKNTTIRIELTSAVQEDDLKLKVNGLVLSPLISSNASNKMYTYEYYFGEKLNISLDFTQNWIKSLYSISCNSSEQIISKKLPELEKERNITLNPKEFKNTTSTLSCLNTYNKKNYSLTLKKITYQDSKLYPQITGISPSRIIAKFINTTFQHEKVLYSYCDNETLTLNCSMNNDGIGWKTNGSEVIHVPNAKTYNTDINIFVDVQSFKLADNVNCSVLTCTHSALNLTDISEIKLIRSVCPKLDSEATTTKAVSEPSTEVFHSVTDSTNVSFYDTNHDNTTSDNTNNNGQNVKPFLKRNYFYIIAGVVVGIICIAVILISVLVCRKAKKVQPKSELDIDYENLPQHNEGPMPMPSQWNTNEYANSTEGLYSNVNNEPSYAKAIPKSQRNKLTETYRVPYMCTDPTTEYATPYNSKDCAIAECAYAEIIPPSERNKDSTINPNPQNANYALPIPKALRNKLNKVLPTSDSYAEISSTRNRAYSDKNKYENVFNKEKYVNAKPSDYIEPAYASVEKKN